MKANNPINLTCEYRNNPLGIDVAHPRLSWQIYSERRGVRQTAYRIVAALNEADLINSESLLWDSERIESDCSIQVPYEGEELQSGQRIYWQVTIWDQDNESATSNPAWWEMGLLSPSDWKAKWIGASIVGGPRTTSPAPHVRQEFDVSKPVVKARLYATAIGLYECYLNGVCVGEDVLTPGWTDYNQRVRYQTYDVSNMLQQGRNAIGAILGDGWAVGHVAWAGRQRYVDRPRFLAQLVITYADGTLQVVATNDSWKTSTGPILESDMMMGESYDARREIGDWHTIDFDDTPWAPVNVSEETASRLVANNGPTVKRIEEVRPVCISALHDLVNPRWVIDFGQNMVGWVRLKVRGSSGTTISIRHAEALNPDGTIHTNNLRTARGNDFYTLKGEAEEIWEPRFTFHGFRYIELSGFPGEPTEESVTGIVIHTDMPHTGSFECSNSLINQLQSNILWSQKGNFVDVPTDCPQRDERLGWTGDAQVFVQTAAFNMNVAGFFTKWLQDVKDAQLPNGAYPAIAPNPLDWPLGEGGPAWADAGVIIPWEIYLRYGDTSILEQCYESMCRYVEFLKETSRDGLRCYPDYEGWHGFGDWLALDGSDGREGGTSKELIGTAFYAHSAHLMSRIADLLDKPQAAADFRALSLTAKRAFQDKFVREDGTIAEGTQTAYVLALHFHLMPEELQPMAAQELVRLITDNSDHLSTGFVGTPYINWVLSEAGYLSTAYKLLLQNTWPSWLYSVLNGGTTIWERWDGWTHDEGFQDQNMNSFNHYAYGAIGAWLYAVVAGIDLDPLQPGYKHVVMYPRPGGELTNAKAELHSMYGTIRSEWTLENGAFQWSVSVPANTSATIYLPAEENDEVLEGAKRIEDIDTVCLVRHERNASVYEIGSGDYCFTVRRQRASRN